MTDKRVLDCKGFACPQPVIRTKDVIEKMAIGDQLVVIVDNEASSKNVSRFAESRGHSVRIEEKGNDIYDLTIRINESLSTSETPEIVCDEPRKKSMAVYITSEVMGQGDDELGRILMSAYFETLSHFANEITHIIFVNSGVKLAVEGSPVLEELQGLENMGIEVLSCGTCLNHFGIKEKLKAGVISNMFTILDTLSKTGKILTP